MIQFEPNSAVIKEVTSGTVGIKEVQYESTNRYSSVDLNKLERKENFAEESEIQGNQIMLSATVNSKDEWEYIIPREDQLRSLCRKHNLVFDGYNYRSIKGWKNIKNTIPVKIHSVCGDGHCGYKSISYLLCGTDSEHLKVRKVICEFIEQLDNPKFTGLYPDGKEEAARKKNAAGTVGIDYWMTDTDIVAAAILFQINIVVLTQQRKWHYFSPNFGKPNDWRFDNQIPSILLDNSSGNHFNPILEIGIVCQ